MPNLTVNNLTANDLAINSYIMKVSANSSKSVELTQAEMDDSVAILEAMATSGLISWTVAQTTRTTDDPAETLLAALNLSDVNSAATARSNIGANIVILTVPRIALDAAAVYYLQSPVAGTITNIRTAITGALTGGDPTITASIGGAAVTGGVVTIANASSAAGDKDIATPTAANVVAVGDNIELTVAANSQSNSEFADLTMLITY